MSEQDSAIAPDRPGELSGAAREPLCRAPGWAIGLMSALIGEARIFDDEGDAQGVQAGLERFEDEQLWGVGDILRVERFVGHG